MISSDSFVLDSGDNSKNAFNLLATRSFTRPAFLDLGGRQQPFLEAGIQSSQHGTRTSSIPLLYPLDHKLSTRFGSQDGVPTHIPDDGRIGGIGNRNKEEEMLKKVEMGKNPKECLTEMSKNGKMQDGLGNEMV